MIYMNLRGVVVFRLRLTGVCSRPLMRPNDSAQNIILFEYRPNGRPSVFFGRMGNYTCNILVVRLHMPSFTFLILLHAALNEFAAYVDLSDFYEDFDWDAHVQFCVESCWVPRWVRFFVLTYKEVYFLVFQWCLFLWNIL